MSSNYDMEPVPPTDPVWWAIASMLLLAAIITAIIFCRLKP